jgi:hypothetical protein
MESRESFSAPCEGTDRRPQRQKVWLERLLREADYLSVNPVQQRDARHDRRALVRADAGARLLHHDGARFLP